MRLILEDLSGLTRAGLESTCLDWRRIGFVDVEGSLDLSTGDEEVAE